MRRLAALFALTLMLAMSGAAFAATPQVGEAAPAFRLQDQNGHWLAPDDFRASYFEGDRLARAVAHTEEIRKDIAGTNYTLAQTALKFVLAHPAVSTVIPGIRNVAQADATCGVSDLAVLPYELLLKLRRHNWRRGIWYGGK